MPQSLRPPAPPRAEAPFRARCASALLCLLAALCGAASAQSEPPPPLEAPAAAQDDAVAPSANAAPLEAWLQDTNSTDPAPPPAPADLWARLRAGMALDSVDDERVERIARQFAHSGFALRAMKRAEPFLYLAVDEALALGYPAEIALLPFIESGFNLSARSQVGASGAWQFMPLTGREYGLAASRIVDLRRGFVASTRAALRMLGGLHARYGDWALALAAYNWGPGNVDRAIARNRAAGQPSDYASLRMPDETRNYVPSLLAMRAIIGEPERFGVQLPEMANEAKLLRVPLRRDIDIALAARLAQMDEAAFRRLNPASNLPVLVAASQHEILLPPEKAALFVQGLARHAGPLSSWSVLRLERKESVKALAARIGVKPDVVRLRNDIPPGFLLKAGSVVVVPRQGAKADIPRALAESAPLAMERETPPTKRVLVAARKGERLAALAKRFQVDLERVKRWNPGLGGAALRAQQKVALELPWKQALALEAGAAKAGRTTGKPQAGKGGKGRLAAQHGRPAPLPGLPGRLEHAAV